MSRVRYRFIACPECNHLGEYIGDRAPNHCVECGKSIFEAIRTQRPGVVLIDDRKARLKHHAPAA